jgi:hypothetical protein
LPGDNDAEPIAQRIWNLILDGHIPATMKIDATEATDASTQAAIRSSIPRL